MGSLDDVLGRRPGGIDDPIPPPPQDGGYLKVKSIPVHVEHGMDVGHPVETTKGVCQTAGVGIVPSRVIEPDAVPDNVQQTALVHLPFEEAAGTPGPEIGACGDEQLPESQERVVFFHETPVEPADLIVLAVSVVVAALC